MAEEKTLSRQLAEFVNQVEFGQLPTKTVQITILSFLDWLGSGIAGGRELPSRIMEGIIADAGGKEQATLVANGGKTSALWAALLNGVSSHILELDDVHKASILHAGAPIIPAALAATELVSANGQKLLEGIVAGYDVGIRIGEAVTPSHYKKWHTTGTCGTFGAAAAAGKILGLTVEQLIHAIGNAGSQAAGLWEFVEDGAMTKHLHPGKAAFNGLLSSLLARSDFTGATRILEGDRGFFQSMSTEYDASRVTEGLGADYKIMENCFKVHSSCRHTHPALDVVVDLAEREGIRPQDVQSVKIGVYQIAVDIAGNREPDSIYAAKFSLPYCTALGLTKRCASFLDFTSDNLYDPEIRRIMKVTEVHIDQEVQAKYPGCCPAKVAIETTKGTFAGYTDYPKGDPENPVTKADLEKKFNSLVEPCLDAHKTRKITEAVWGLAEGCSVKEVLKWIS